MLKASGFIGAVLVALSVSTSASAVMVNSPSLPYPGGQLGRTYDASFFSSGPTVISFDNASLGCVGAVAGLSGDYSLQNSGSAAATIPGGDSTCFLAAPGIDSPSSTGSATLNFTSHGLGAGMRIDTLGFYWGSIGAGDTLEFLDSDGNAMALGAAGFEITGLELLAMIDALGADASQSREPTNRYVYFNFDASEIFNSIRFTSIGRAFEVDTIAFSIVPAAGGEEDVPEPAVFGLMGLGLLGIGAARRRKA